MIFQKFGIYIRTYRRYRFKQILWKFRLLINRLICFVAGSALLKYNLRDTDRLSIREDLVRDGFQYLSIKGNVSEINDSISRAKKLITGCITFLNNKQNFKSNPFLEISQISKLWLYHLHYLSIGYDLALSYFKTNEELYYVAFKDLITKWKETTSWGKGLPYREAYLPAHRVIYLIKSFLLLLKQLDNDSAFRTQFLRIIIEENLFVEKNLEYHIPGNHLIKDAKALIFCGAFFRGRKAEKWLNKGEEILFSQVEKQVFDDGGHFERSPMYHAIVLQDVLESVMLLNDLNRQIPVWLLEKLNRMVEFLQSMTHPNGELALFGDSSCEFETTLAGIFNLANSVLKKKSDKILGHQYDEKMICKAYPDSGYYLITNSKLPHYLIIDGGAIANHNLPAHSHCDGLSFELSVAEQKIIIDSGAYLYEPGKWRDFFRSTRAHNTVQVDGSEQAEMWGSFRMGRQSRVRVINWLIEPNFVYWEAVLTFPKSNKMSIRRRIIYWDDGFWTIVDKLEGRDYHQMESLLHLSPDLYITNSNLHNGLIFNTITNSIFFAPFSNCKIEFHEGEHEPIQGWHSPSFGHKIPNKVISMQTSGMSPLCLAYILVPFNVTKFAGNYQENEGGFHLEIELNHISYGLESVQGFFKFKRHVKTRKRQNPNPVFKPVLSTRN